MSHAPDLSMAHTGDILGGRYILRERLGSGGMGRVFRARDEVLARDVAIKIFHTDGGGEPEPLRRMAEARALAALDHPSLVTLYDARLIGEEHVYLVMELITGPSLQRRIEERAIPAGELAGILNDLAGALAVVHDAGIVHRDVKPSNVLLRPLYGATRDAEAVLADFGVAHLIDATRLTTPGTVIGTAAYLAPEQLRGEAPQPASDVYALGLLAIEALTRLHPFGAGSLQETLLARLARQPRLPDDLSPAWRALLVAMTAADAGTRPSAASVAESAAELMTEEITSIPDAAEQLAGWMLPTAPLTVPAVSATAARPALAAQKFLAPPVSAAASGSSVAVAADAAAGAATSSDPEASVIGARIGEKGMDATAPRRAANRRPRRRGWAWIAAGTGAALIVGGHLAAFSLGAAHDISSDRAPLPVSTPAPAATDAVATVDEPSATPAPATSAAPVDATDSSQQPAPEVSTPAQADPVLVTPVTAVSDDSSPSEGGGPAPAAEVADAPVVAETTEPGGPGRGAPGRPDSPGNSEGTGKGHGTGPSGPPGKN